MNNLPHSDNESSPAPIRPVWLSVLCILTFIGSGISTVSFLMIYISYEEVLPMMKELGNLFPGMDLIATAGKNFFLTGFILYFLSLMGASFMWRLRKIGFHFYTASQVMIVLLPVVYINDYPAPFFEALITAAFILFYVRFLKLMV